MREKFIDLLMNLQETFDQILLILVMRCMRQIERKKN